MDNEKQTIHTVIILDKSGSMGCIREEAIQHYNEQVQTLKSKAEEFNSKVSLILFNFDVDVVLFEESPDKIGELTLHEYQPNGSTALRDAVGYAINRLKEKSPGTAKEPVLFVIISDGEENASTEYDATTLAEMVQTMRTKHGWTFTYIGTDHDLSKVSDEIGIPKGNMVLFKKSAGGMNRMRGFTNQKFSGYYASMSNKPIGASISASNCVFSSSADITDLSGNDEEDVKVTTGSHTENGSPKWLQDHIQKNLTGHVRKSNLRTKSD